MYWASKGPIKGVRALTPNFDPYACSYKHIFIQNASKLQLLYSTRLVGYEYVKINMLDKYKTHFWGVGAPTPIFEPYISSYIHIFGQMPENFSFCIQLN